MTADQPHPPLAVQCGGGDYTGTTGREMQTHAHITGHHAFYVMRGK